jgi:hypothetical protein
MEINPLKQDSQGQIPEVVSLMKVSFLLNTNISILTQVSISLYLHRFSSLSFSRPLRIPCHFWANLLKIFCEVHSGGYNRQDMSTSLSFSSPSAFPVSLFPTCPLFLILGSSYWSAYCSRLGPSGRYNRVLKGWGDAFGLCLGLPYVQVCMERLYRLQSSYIIETGSISLISLWYLQKSTSLYFVVFKTKYSRYQIRMDTRYEKLQMFKVQECHKAIAPGLQHITRRQYKRNQLCSSQGITRET